MAQALKTMRDRKDFAKKAFTKQVCKKFGLTNLPSLAALELLREHTEPELTRMWDGIEYEYSWGEDTTNWGAICGSPDPAAMELLKEHLKKINLARLCGSTNPEAIAEVELRLSAMDEYCWGRLTENPCGNAVELMMCNPSRIDFRWLAKNQSPDVEVLLMYNLDKFAPWYRECTNPGVFN